MAYSTVDAALFFLFVRLVDERQAIGLRDLEKLDQLLEKPKLLGVSTLEPAIEELAKHYPEYWHAYQQGKFAISDSDSELDHLMKDISQTNPDIEWVELQNGLIEWIKYFCVSNSLVAKLHLQESKSQRQHRLARADVLIGLVSSCNSAGKVSAQLSEESQSVSKASLSAYREHLHRLLRTETGTNQLPIFTKGAHRLVCTHVKQENHQVKTFTFVSPVLSAWVFEPGQFLTFDVPTVDGLVKRSYSIFSSPAQPYAIEVTIKRLPNGKASNWFYDQMIVGKEIAVHGPHGNFSLLESNSKSKVAFFAAGVGITPIMSMLQWISHTKHEVDVVLINRVHSHADHIYMADPIAIGANPFMNLRQYTMTTHHEGNWHESLGLLGQEKGSQITPEFIEGLVPDILERDVYLCGPHFFKDSVLASLQFLNFDASRFFSESFGGLNQNQHALLEGKSAKHLESTISSSIKHLNREIAPEHQCEIEFTQSGKTVVCEKGDLILDVAEFNGVNIPNSCRSGSCGTCKCHLESGSVAMDNEDGLSPADLVAGNILSCVSRVQSKKVVIDA